jgi:hypothetical protein
MSIKLMSAAWDLDIPSTEKMVLLCLCDYSNDTGVCWPSVPTIATKCSKSHRTIQAAIQWLRNEGYCSWDETPGKPHKFALDPRKICTPAKSAPPQELRDTPAEVAPHPRKSCTQTIKNHQEPPSRARKRAPIPDDWQPRPFAEGTKSREIVDSWPAGELEAQLEQMKANHRGKGNTFLDPQDAWQTWVLNTRKFGIGRKDSGAAKYVSKSGHEYRGELDSIIREAERRGDNDTYWKAKGDRSRGAKSVGEVLPYFKTIANG